MKRRLLKITTLLLIVFMSVGTMHADQVTDGYYQTGYYKCSKEEMIQMEQEAYDATTGIKEVK